MPKFFRSLGLLTALLYMCGVQLSAQDLSVRVEAVKLMEHANAVSRPTHRTRNHKEEVTFRAYRLDGTTVDGRADNIIAGDIERYETTFGDFHSISIHFPDKIVQNDFPPEPAETLELEKLTPLLIGSFDKSDIIHSITPATLNGRSAKCVQFETVNGRTRQPANEICFDYELGALVRWNVAEDLIEDTDYVSFEGVLMPRTIRHYINGKLRMEVKQEFSVIEDPIDWAALTPPDAHPLRTCYDYKPPAIQSAPQPADAGSGPWYDVQVHGGIGPDGRVQQATVLPAGRPDLERRAIEIVSSWVFSAPLCNGKPTIIGIDLVVHFAPR
jgi:Gram-negative bacterial TonB protein C-terminal